MWFFLRRQSRYTKPNQALAETLQLAAGFYA